MSKRRKQFDIEPEKSADLLQSEGDAFFRQRKMKQAADKYLKAFLRDEDHYDLGLFFNYDLDLDGEKIAEIYINGTSKEREALLNIVSEELMILYNKYKKRLNK